MIREARFGDLPRLWEVFFQMHAASIYADTVPIDEPALRSLLMDCVKRSGGQHAGSTLFLVAEKNDRIEGFFIGILDRVYHVGKRLRANDMFLFSTKDAPPRAAAQMFERYIAWATENPKCCELLASWVDAIDPRAERIEKLYRQRGFRRCGAIWMRGADSE